MISWIAFIFAVVGAHMVAVRSKRGFVMLGISNVLWVAYAIYTRQYAILGQQAIFFGYAIYSYRQWSNRAELDWLSAETHRLSPEQCRMWRDKGSIDPELFRKLYLNEPAPPSKDGLRRREYEKNPNPYRRR